MSVYIWKWDNFCCVNNVLFDQGRWLLASCPQATEHQEFMSAVHSSQTNHFAF